MPSTLPEERVCCNVANTGTALGALSPVPTADNAGSTHMGPHIASGTLLSSQRTSAAPSSAERLAVLRVRLCQLEPCCASPCASWPAPRWPVLLAGGDDTTMRFLDCKDSPVDPLDAPSRGVVGPAGTL